MNNPKRHQQIHGRDHGTRFTLEDLVALLIEAAAKNADDDELCDLLDREFLFGAWRSELESRVPELIRDLRGVIISLAKKASDYE